MISCKVIEYEVEVPSTEENGTQSQISGYN